MEICTLNMGIGDIQDNQQPDCMEIRTVKRHHKSS